MDAKKLRKQVDERNRIDWELREKKVQQYRRETFYKMYRGAIRAIQEAVAKGHSQTVVCSIPSYQDSWYEMPHEGQYDWLDDDREKIRRAIEFRQSLNVRWLRDLPGSLRDCLQKRGFQLQLSMRTEGDRCNTRHNVWDMTARW